MRLLFLSNFYPPYDMGGYEGFCAEVAVGLRQRGHGVCVLTSNRGVMPDELLADDVERTLHLEVDMRPLHATAQFFWGRQRRVTENVNRLRMTIARRQPDILMVWGMWNLPRQLLVFAENCAVPKVVYYIADYWPLLPDAYTLHWQEPARRWYARTLKRGLWRIARRQLSGQRNGNGLRFERAICVSQAVRRNFIAARLPFESARVIHIGIDTRQFASAQTTPRESDSIGPLRILYVGRLTFDKGVHTIIEAVAMVRLKSQSLQLAVVGAGDPSYEADLRELSVKLDVTDCVTFAGGLPRSQIPEVMAAHQVLIVPSIWDEPLPRAAQEGMAAGLAVIASAVGGLPELITDGVNGLLFTPNDAAQLARQIEQLIILPSLRSQIAAAGQATVREHFHIEHCVVEIEDYLRACVA